MQQGPVTLVEVRILPGVLVGPIPPEPVRAFRQVHVILGQCQVFGRNRLDAALVIGQHRAGLAQVVPGRVFLALPNPGVVVGAEPRPREQVFDHALFGELLQIRRGSDGFNPLGLGEQAVHLAEEVDGVVVVIFPGVFPVQNDADHVRAFSALFLQPRADVLQAAHQILGPRLAAHPRVVEAKLIGDHSIAEEHRHLVARSIFDVIRAVQIVRLLHGFLPVAGKAAQSQRLGQHRLAGRHPLVPLLDDERHHQLRHRALAGPQTARSLPKDALVDFHALLQVHHRIRRVHERVGQL